MKFANLFSIISVAIFSFAMSSAHAGLRRLSDSEMNCLAEDCAVVQASQTTGASGCGIINGVEVCRGEKNYNTPPVYTYNTQPPLQVINIGYIPVMVDARLADRAWSYINVTCPKYAMTSAATSFIADMSTVQFNGLSAESQMFLTACNAK